MSLFPRRRGFTLFQLLILLALLALLLALLLPAVQKTRQAAARIQCSNNLKQQVLATINCADTNDGKMPPGVGYYPSRKADTKNNGFGTLFFHDLPYIEQEPLYKSSFDKDDQLYAPWNNDVYGTIIKTYICPTDTSVSPDHRYEGWLATSNYAANYLIFGISFPQGFGPGSQRYPASISDGTSQTIFVTERYQLCNGVPNAWGYYGASAWTPVFIQDGPAMFQVTPLPKECDPSMAQSPHPGGINVGLGDGSVRFVSQKVSPQTWWAACTPNEGDVLGSDW
jgi:prepilin-type processing-associated H-X9-DG protein